MASEILKWGVGGDAAVVAVADNAAVGEPDAEFDAIEVEGGLDDVAVDFPAAFFESEVTGVVVAAPFPTLLPLGALDVAVAVAVVEEEEEEEEEER